MSGARTIFAMGGGGFTMEPDNPVLDDFVLGLAAAREPRILFLPTASGDPAAQIAAFHDRFAGRACAPAHLSLFRLHGMRRPLREIVLEQDVDLHRRRLDAQPAGDLARARARRAADGGVGARDRARRAERRRDVLVRGRHHALERPAGDDRRARAAAAAR